jgi:hypothetical protein
MTAFPVQRCEIVRSHLVRGLFIKVLRTFQFAGAATYLRVLIT